MLKLILSSIVILFTGTAFASTCEEAVTKAFDLPQAQPEVKNPALRRLSIVVCHESQPSGIEIFHARLHAPEKYYSGVASSSLYGAELPKKYTGKVKSTGVIFGDKEKSNLINVSLRVRNQANQFSDIAGSVELQGNDMATFSKQGLTVGVKEW